jgi:hypothetical protein
MTNPFSADFEKQYNADEAHFFLRHPLAHFILYWGLFFTVFSIVAAFGSSGAPYPARVDVVRTLFFSCIVTTVGVFVQRRRWKRKLRPPADSERVI